MEQIGCWALANLAQNTGRKMKITAASGTEAVLSAICNNSREPHKLSIALFIPGVIFCKSYNIT
jgi:hypothetical protein